MISQKELLEILDYNPMTGVLTWRKKLNNKLTIGDTAGHICGSGYRIIKLFGKTYSSKNLVFLYMTGKIPDRNQIQHINGDTNDDRWTNLKIRTFHEAITQEVVKEYLHYEPQNGLFIWIKKPRANIMIGDVAGCPDGKGYTKIKLFKKSYLAHRLAFLFMTGSVPKEHTDHINHDRADNRWENLRCVSQAENNKNLKCNTKNTSGKTGVSWHKASKKWCARIGSGDTRVELGYFNLFEDAVAVREKAERELDYHQNHGKIP